MLCFLSVVERFVSSGESSCRRRQLSFKNSGLSGLLSISSTLSLVLLAFPRPSKGSVWESTQTHVGAGTRALLGPRASASRRRALRGMRLLSGASPGRRRNDKRSAHLAHGPWDLSWAGCVSAGPCPAKADDQLFISRVLRAPCLYQHNPHGGARHAGHIELGRGCCPTAHLVSQCRFWWIFSNSN